VIRLSSLRLCFTSALLVGCVPNTYYDTSDPYAYGVRWYDRGRYDLAAQYWDPLVEKGDCDAEYWVGMLYFLGRGKPQDNEKALGLWRKAANGNHPKAQAALGDLYYQNDAVIYHHCKACTVQKDLVTAHVWYKLLEKSARYEGEKKHAAGVLQSISTEMSSEQLSRAEAALVQWTPTPKDCKPRNWW
jgi:hypothetical protein